MADLSDVAGTLVTLCTALVYPNGIAQPSVANTPIRLYYGWPVKAQLDADLAVPICHVSVYPRSQERNSTRYLGQFEQTSINTTLLTLTRAGQIVTVGGIPPATNVHNLAIFVNGMPYVYQTQPADTLATIAAGLAALIAVAVPGTAAVNGVQITIPNAGAIGPVRVGVFGSSSKPVRNQDRVFQIGIWADTPAHRDVIAQTIDPVLAATNFLFFPDGTSGRLIYRGSPSSDQFEKSFLYRRDLMYSVDYATVQVVKAPQIVVVETQTSVAVAGVPPYAPVATTFN